MGYIFGIRAGSIDQIQAELAAPTLAFGVPDRRHIGSGFAAERDRRAELQQSVAVSVGAGKEWEADEDVALYVSEVIEHMTDFWDSIDCTSSGWGAFQAELCDDATAYFGGGLVEDLMDRPIAGIYSYDWPTFGWATTDEIAAVMQRVAPLPSPTLTFGTTDVIRKCAAAAIDANVDLITICC